MALHQRLDPFPVLGLDEQLRRCLDLTNAIEERGGPPFHFRDALVPELLHRALDQELAKQRVVLVHRPVGQLALGEEVVAVEFRENPAGAFLAGEELAERGRHVRQERGLQKEVLRRLRDAGEDLGGEIVEHRTRR